MAKHLQVRDVPEYIHRKLKARAALEGRSLSDYLLDEIKLIVNRPTMEELFAELEALEPVDIGESAADAVRASREERYRDLDALTDHLFAAPKKAAKRKKSARRRKKR